MKSNRKFYSNPLGLTVIELMVVIFAIALIATIGLVSLQKSRNSANDSKRVYDLQQYVKAIRLYDLEKKHYPRGADCLSGICSGQLGWNKSEPPNDVLAKFFPDLPHDPKANGNIGDNDYYYYYNESNPNCNGKPTISAQNMESNKSEYYFNPCPSDSAAYLIIVE